MNSSYKDPRFQRALNLVLRFEGGYSDHPKDPGGATKFGITRRTLATWRGIKPWWKLPKVEVKQLGRTEASKIYFVHYWQRSGANELPEALGFVLFDFAVNSGPQRAVKQLQRQLNVRADGIVGPVTRAAINNYCRKHTLGHLVKTYVARRHKFLKSLRTYQVFGKGWSNRIAGVLAAAQEILRKSSNKEKSKMKVFTGYKTYIVALIMLFSGVLELLGVNVPAIEAGNATQLIMESLAIIFLRKGIKTEISNA